MKILEVIAVIVVLIIFIPLPINITLKYDRNLFLFKIYNYKIDFTKRKAKKEIDKAARKTNEFTMKKGQKIMRLLGESKFKPSLNFNLEFQYGLDDAAQTAITYGLLWNALPILYNLASVIFKVKKFDMNIVPHFNEELLKLDLHCIIFASIAKTIYIGVLIGKVLKE